MTMDAIIKIATAIIACIGIFSLVAIFKTFFVHALIIIYLSLYLLSYITLFIIVSAMVKDIE